MLKREEIRIRDPFIFTDKESGCYYMYGTTALNPDSIGARATFSVYKSYDLENFEEPKVIFDGKKQGFWADRDYWAAELHEYKGKYYLFGSVIAEGRCRTTEIFVSDRPDGEFVPHLEKPVTPEGWVCLDGTFFVEDGIPYMIFCHEWVQVHDGEICAIRLSDDLKRAVGEPVLLFRASSEPTVEDIGSGNRYNLVTDGPFLFREDGRIKMIWSSFTAGKRYTVLMAESDSLLGEWKQRGSCFDFNGGHAMIFETLSGERMISLHSPNTPGLERAKFIKF